MQCCGAPADKTTTPVFGALKAVEGSASTEVLLGRLPHAEASIEAPSDAMTVLSRGMGSPGRVHGCEGRERQAARSTLAAMAVACDQTACQRAPRSS